ncbi:response regulator transcription factor [Aureibacillus halotolerans]|uniref:AraC family two component transcriptional regulator n=1 Tax=Aureibacillus halotolerans TaxID=1508390 RepID=A0A4R6U681_9BACI|nr:helix-turn-helix domain-containing protein [Aureibacillus halotolerans]TDQ41092.1 AraC family two component transcriptional regulator [Aureibacillus halotolerans]
MASLMIVDDEWATVEGLKLLTWSQVDIDHVITAQSAAEALTLAQRQKVDVLVTDIRMPGMNGLELIKTLSKEQSLQSILLSGYADFHYAQQALELQTVSYLLKPVADEDLLDAVQKAVQRSYDGQHYASLNEALHTMELYQSNEISASIKHLLSPKKTTEDLLDEYLPLDASVQYGTPFCMVVRPATAVDQTAPLLMKSLFSFWHGTVDGYAVYLCASPFHSREYLDDALEREALMKDLAVQMNTSHIAVSPWGTFPFDLASYFQDCLAQTNQLSCNSTTFAVTQAKKYIEGKIQHSITLQDTANHVFLNPTYLSKIFKQETGQSFSSYVLHYRMLLASQRLTETNQKITDIAGTLGFRDASYFIRVFRKHYGKTPAEYRHHYS